MIFIDIISFITKEKFTQSFYLSSSGLLRIMGPSSVIATVCSMCAERLPSAVMVVHPSSRILILHEPRLIIGSIAMTIPALSIIPVPGVP